MNNYSKYTTPKKKLKVFPLIMMIILVAVMIWGVLEICGVFGQPDYYEPTSVHPMANAQISWQQTFHAGGWSEAQ